MLAFLCFRCSKIYSLVNFLTTQQMKCKHFFVFAVPKFGCLWKSAYFCPRHKEKLEKNDIQNRTRDLMVKNYIKFDLNKHLKYYEHRRMSQKIFK